MTKPPSMRLDRLLSNLGYGSRKEMTGAIRNGWVTMAGAEITDPGHPVPLDLYAQTKGRLAASSVPSAEGGRMGSD